MKTCCNVFTPTVGFHLLPHKSGVEYSFAGGSGVWGLGALGAFALVGDLLNFGVL